MKYGTVWIFENVFYIQQVFIVHLGHIGRVLDAGGRAVTLPLLVEHFDGVGRQQEIKYHR